MIETRHMTLIGPGIFDPVPRHNSIRAQAIAIDHRTFTKESRDRAVASGVS
jgi:hypothetical protein